MPNIPAELVGREEIRAGGERLQAQWDFFVQTTHPGTIQLDGDTATGRAYIQELARAIDGRQGLNFAIYHDRYRRTGDGWKFAERVYEVSYLDTSPLAGAAPIASDGPACSPIRRPPSALERAAEALRANGFAVEILDDVAAARVRVKELIPAGAGVFTAASETLRLSGIDAGHQHQRPVRGRQAARHWPWTGPPAPTRSGGCSPAPTSSWAASHAVTETGSLVVASASGSQLPGYAGGAARAIWIVGAQKVVPDLSTALRRVEDHCPAAGERPRPGGLRAAERRQPPPHPQRRAPPRAGHRPAAPRSHRLLSQSASRVGSWGLAGVAGGHCQRHSR